MYKEIDKLTDSELHTVADMLSNLPASSDFEVLGVFRKDNKLDSVSVKVESEFVDKVVLLKMTEREVNKSDQSIRNTPRHEFSEIVEWAYSTLPQKVRVMEDFPGIQIEDEPPPEVLKEKNWPKGIEMLGCYVGAIRTIAPRRQIKISPDVIFVFRGPCLRCSKGDLRSEVKRVVWHEVAHWLGHNSEEDVAALGL